MRAQKLTIAAEDVENSVYLSENVAARQVIRVHYRIARLSGESSYTLAHFSNATGADRAAAEAAAARFQLDELFADLKARGALFRRRSPEDRRRWIEYGMFGSVAPDPLIQLELEMMVDLDAKAVA